MISRANSNNAIELSLLGDSAVDASASMEQLVINWDYCKKPLQEKSVFELGLPDDIKINIVTFLGLSDFFHYHSLSKQLRAQRSNYEEILCCGKCGLFGERSKVEAFLYSQKCMDGRFGKKSI